MIEDMNVGSNVAGQLGRVSNPLCQALLLCLGSTGPVSVTLFSMCDSVCVCARILLMAFSLSACPSA